MSSLLRRTSRGRLYFFTVETLERRPVLMEHPQIFLDAWRDLPSGLAPDLRAWALLPDHFHAIVALGRHDPTELLQHVKVNYTLKYCQLHGIVKASLWQTRDREHAIRDERELAHGLNYVHLNAVKHGLVAAPSHWRWSSFADYVARGQYPEDWCDYEENDWSNEMENV